MEVEWGVWEEELWGAPACGWRWWRLLGRRAEVMVGGEGRGTGGELGAEPGEQQSLLAFLTCGQCGRSMQTGVCSPLLSTGALGRVRLEPATTVDMGDDSWRCERGVRTPCPAACRPSLGEDLTRRASSFCHRGNARHVVSAVQVLQGFDPREMATVFLAFGALVCIVCGAADVTCCGHWVLLAEKAFQLTQHEG